MTIIVSPYQSHWTTLFEKEKKRLVEAFESDFFHIGSTAIPGCRAKPIIDILGVTSDVTALDSQNSKFEELGYEALGEYGMMQRRFFRKKGFHLHIFEESDPEVERHLRFCTYLREHPTLVEEYSRLKEELAKKHPEDIVSYILGKQIFINEIDKKAAWETSEFLYKKKRGLKKWKWSKEEILKVHEVNFHTMMTYFSKCTAGIEFVFEPDCTVVRSKIATHNNVLAAGFTTEKRVVEIISLFDSPFSWWVFDFDSPPELENILIANGLQFTTKHVGMFLDLDNFCAKSDSPLEFRQVETLSDLRDFAKIAAFVGENGELFDKYYSQIPPILYRPGNSLEMHVGYLDKVPVTIGMVLLHAGAGGIYYLATLPEKRRKGYGGAMVEHLLQRSKDAGYHLAILQATVEGLRLYEDLGFRPCCFMKEYTKMFS